MENRQARRKEKAFIAKVGAAIKVEISKPGGMERMLDHLWGSGNWTYDSLQDVYVVPDKKHAGAGKGFWIIRPDGSWFHAVVPAGMIS